MSNNYSVRKTSKPNTIEYRVYLEKDTIPISSWHDIPLYADREQNVLNMIVEIPRWTNAKFEIARDEYLNPIKQDMKKGSLRYVHNRFPYKGYIWNYGALPSTWEDPNTTLPETGTNGDNDPLDACEIGEQVAYTGQVKQVKVLGVMCLLDEGETDWKIIVIDVKDPLASKLNDIADIETHMPGLLTATTEWFKYYKIPDGKPENKVAFNGQFKNREYALNIVHECAESWNKLINGNARPGTISLSNVTHKNTPRQLNDQSEVPKAADMQAAPMEQNIDKWFFVPESVIKHRYGSL